jgi:hypothetical protein
VTGPYASTRFIGSQGEKHEVHDKNAAIRRPFGYTIFALRQLTQPRLSPHFLETLMYRMFKTLPWLATACVLAVSLAACNKTPNAPTESEAAGVATEAGPNGETLKVQAPSPVSPTNDLTIDSRRPTMVVTNVQGKFVGGAFSYEFELLNDGNTAIDRSTQPSGGNNRTQWAYPTDLERDTPYRWRARARMGAAVGPWSTASRFKTIFEKRTPDPDPNSICFDAVGNVVRNCIPPPNMLHIVQQVVAANPGILTPRRSCQEAQWGGDHVTGWEFLDKLVDALRLEDTRFGYNCKRGNCGDPSVDVIAYHYGPGPDEGSPNIWAWDVVTGHCGGGAAPNWSHITNVRGSGGGFTSRGRW